MHVHVQCRSAMDTALLPTPLHWDAPQELLAMVPQPVLAVLMLFPVTEASEKAKDEEDARLKVRHAETRPLLRRLWPPYVPCCSVQPTSM